MPYTSIRTGALTVFVLLIHIFILWVVGLASPAHVKKPSASLSTRFITRSVAKNTATPAIASLNFKAATSEAFLKNNSTLPIVDYKSAPEEENANILNDALIASANANDWFEKSPSSYLLREEIDMAAEPLIDMGVQFARLFPLFSGTVIVEFWIDATGKVSRVDIKQGRTLVHMNIALAEMLEFYFLPAQREGVLVGSRKLIVIDTNVLVP